VELAIKIKIVIILCTGMDVITTMSPSMLYSVRRINSSQYYKYKFPRIHHNIDPRISHKVQVIHKTHF